MDELVSVIVISYNSNKYIIDALNSIYQQTYKRIELIVFDDCSKDSSFDLANNWIQINKCRFVEAFAFQQSKNVGSCQNLNDAINCSNGKYIKIIAADDLLQPHCIEVNLKNILDSKGSIKFQFSKLFIFENEDEVNLKDFDSKDELYCCFDLTAHGQYIKLLELNFVPAPTMFFEKEAFIKNGMFNSKFDIYEDLPLWIKVTKLGEKLYLVDEYLVKYRSHNNSITGLHSKNLMIKNPRYFFSQRKFFFYELAFDLLKNFKIIILLDRLLYYSYGSLVLINGNNNNTLNKIIKMLFSKLSPKYILKKIRSINK